MVETGWLKLKQLDFLRVLPQMVVMREIHIPVHNYSFPFYVPAQLSKKGTYLFCYYLK